MVSTEQRIEPQPTWPHDPEPDRITNMTGGFFDGAAKAHAVPKDLRGRIVDAERRADGWYWVQQKEIEYCPVCQHNMALHNPDGSCGCGMDCAAERDEATLEGKR